MRLRYCLPAAALLAAAFALPWRPALGRTVRTASSRASAAVAYDRAIGPNYGARLKNRIAWPCFPLTVAFVQDENYTPEREQAALDGFDHWVRATERFVQYRVDDSAGAQVVVRFDPTNPDGLTTTKFRNGGIYRAELRVGVKRDAYNDIECIAAHEFGHALGIDGHSDDRRDLMYPVHWAGTPCRVSERDLNTLATRYPELARRVERARASRGVARAAAAQTGAG